MSWVGAACGSEEERPGWAAVIVEPPSEPEGSNENTAQGSTGQDRLDPEAILAAIRSSGHHVREADARALARTERLRELVARIRDHLQEALARADRAEARERDTRLWAQSAVAAAEERVQAAEERARTAETWLARIAEAVRTEFPAVGNVQLGQDRDAA